MTTTVGFVCSDGVVLATDTRVTAGGFVAHKRAKKLVQVDEHLAVTMSGGWADCQHVIENLQFQARLYKLERGRPMPVQSAARIVSNMVFPSRYNPFIAVILVGGYDKNGGSLYNLDFFGSIVKDDVSATGSGSPVALGVLEEGYEKGMTVARGVPLAANAIITAMRRNVYTGDHFDIAVIDKSGFKEISEAEKDGFVSKFASRN
jgi:proteasome beta subunit